MSLTLLIMPLVQIDWKPLWEDYGFPLAIMGLLVVFAALILLRVFIGFMPRFLKILDQFFPENSEGAHTAKVIQAAADEIPEEVIAVIAAAVAVTVLQPHRIVHMYDLSGEDTSWSLEGRLQHHASHRIQPRNPS